MENWALFTVPHLATELICILASLLYQMFMVLVYINRETRTTKDAEPRHIKPDDDDDDDAGSRIAHNRHSFECRDDGDGDGDGPPQDIHTLAATFQSSLPI